jgi:predicted ATPase
MIDRFILTGAPGAGKTVLLRQLEHDGYSVVEEAATDVIALEQALGIEESWRDPAFTEKIARLQLQRLSASAHAAGPQFHDRSVFCTYALARYLGHPIPDLLETAVRHALAEHVFARRVFFIGLLGFITPTAARRINLEEATHFEAVHEQVYRDFGFELFPIPPGTIAARTAAIVAAAAEAASQM